MSKMEQLEALRQEMYRIAKELTGEDCYIDCKNYLLEDIHRLRGRFMQVAKSQSWQNTKLTAYIKE